MCIRDRYQRRVRGQEIRSMENRPPLSELPADVVELRKQLSNKQMQTMEMNVKHFEELRHKQQQHKAAIQAYKAKKQTWEQETALLTKDNDLLRTKLRVSEQKRFELEQAAEMQISGQQAQAQELQEYAQMVDQMQPTLSKYEEAAAAAHLSAVRAQDQLKASEAVQRALEIRLVPVVCQERCSQTDFVETADFSTQCGEEERNQGTEQTIKSQQLSISVLTRRLAEAESVADMVEAMTAQLQRLEQANYEGQQREKVLVGCVETQRLELEQVVQGALDAEGLCRQG
eukprot:TRINITY_DN7579_c0_g1_i1.p1 TRINITY_DN7579_c0_g1~~TRINITY_DN7579_c0_g1_i1.p1  ORF type:complete len:287 (+),score=92.40 TRINITY_DN7579_c0_g1_i1:81-941(+)